LVGICGYWSQPSGPFLKTLEGCCMTALSDFVFERIAGLETGWFDRNEGSLHPVTREVFRKVRERGSTAEDLYRDLNRMMR
jgi:hypothetical protein